MTSALLQAVREHVQPPGPWMPESAAPHVTGAGGPPQAGAGRAPRLQGRCRAGWACTEVKLPSREKGEPRGRADRKAPRVGPLRVLLLCQRALPGSPTRRGSAGESEGKQGPAHGLGQGRRSGGPRGEKVPARTPPCARTGSRGPSPLFAGAASSLRTKCFH